MFRILVCLAVLFAATVSYGQRCNVQSSSSNSVSSSSAAAVQNAAIAAQLQALQIQQLQQPRATSSAASASSAAPQIAPQRFVIVQNAAPAPAAASAAASAGGGAAPAAAAIQSAPTVQLQAVPCSSCSKAGALSRVRDVVSAPARILGRGVSKSVSIAKVRDGRSFSRSRSVSRSG